MAIKVCRICGKEFETIAYGGGRQFCFQCVPDTQDIKMRTLYKRTAIKKEGVRLLGGCCMKCGDTRHYVLNFHHLNPEEKEYSLGNLIADSQVETFFQEIDKCILLCSNCHQEFHYLEAHEGLKIEDYVDLSKNYKLDNLINREKTYVKHYCIDCGQEIKFFNPNTQKCANCSRLSTRKVAVRPDKISLAKNIAENGFEAVARQYGLTSNSIRKWCDKYGIPRHTQEVRDWYQKNKDTN